MSVGLKQFLLAFFSLGLVLATLFVRMRVDTHMEMKHTGFGYPFQFVFQDFSRYDQQDSFFPSYPKIELKSENPIVGISVPYFLLSWASFFFGLEILIYILETLDFWVRRRFFGGEEAEEDALEDISE